MKKINNFLKKSSRHVIGACIFIILVLSVIFFYSRKTGPVSMRSSQSQQVSVASVNSLSPNNAPLEVIGDVDSENEATILSQVAGEITQLNYQVGDSVSAGAVIATLQNSAQQAAVLQAQGTYNAAQVALTEASGVNTQNSAVTSEQDTEVAQNAETSAFTALQSAYVSLDDAVHTKADVLFNDPRGQTPTLISSLLVPDAQLVTLIQTERGGLEPILANADALTTDTASGDIDANINTMLSDAQTVETFLNNLIEALDETVPTSSDSASTISEYQTSISAARTEVVGTLSNLTTTLSSYDTAVADATTANNTASSTSNSSVALAQADVQVALGELDAAQAALNNTIITSPISGTIVELPITEGDYVPSASEIAEISNPNSLKIVTYVTASDAQTLSVGNTAMINDNIPGIISQISPAIDPQTGTIEVDVSLTGTQSGLVDGDSVTVDLDRTVNTVEPIISSTSTTESIIIPIVALKITPTSPVVFTVDPNTKTLISHDVSIGSILGANIVITQGLTPDMVIVTDARGLTAGEHVTIKGS